MDSYDPRRVLAKDTCSENNWCAACVKEDSCMWCEGGTGASSGSCLSKTETCLHSMLTESSQCPQVRAAVLLRNVTGLLGAMVAVGIFLNILNRYTNKRRRKKLKESIFTLPVYVYPSRERRAAALKEARSLVAPPGSTGDVEEPAADAIDEDDGDDSVTCAICLSTYEDEEVIKVLPCGHDFHAGCLDEWLALKAMCPLCKAPAFAKKREASWTGHAQFQVHAPSPVADVAGDPPRGLALLQSPSTRQRQRSSSRQSVGVDARGVRLNSVRSLRGTRVDSFEAAFVAATAAEWAATSTGGDVGEEKKIAGDYGATRLGDAPSGVGEADECKRKRGVVLEERDRPSSPSRNASKAAQQVRGLSQDRDPSSEDMEEGRADAVHAVDVDVSDGRDAQGGGRGGLVSPSVGGCAGEMAVEGADAPTIAPRVALET